METISLKSLALKVLERNLKGNQMETIPIIDGNFEDKNRVARKPTKEDVLSLGLSEFKTQNLAVRIRSRILGEDIWLVSNEEARDHLKAEGLVCYLANEIPHLKGLSLEALKKIHETRRIFEKSQIIG